MTPDERMDDRVALSMIGLVSSGVVLAVGFLLVGRHAPMGAAHTVSALPLVNAWLNGTSALLLAAGYWFIRQRKVTAHKTCMVIHTATGRDLERTRVQSLGLLAGRPEAESGGEGQRTLGGRESAVRLRRCSVPVAPPMRRAGHD
jgi:hypothetical protein